MEKIEFELLLAIKKGYLPDNFINSVFKFIETKS